MRLSKICLAMLVAMAMNCQLIEPVFCQEGSPATDANPGMVFVNGQWSTPDQVVNENKKNAVLNDYVAVRKQAADNFDGQTWLANWCDSRDLAEQRDAHWQRALAFNPENVEIRNRLGHLNFNGTWLTPEQIANDRRMVAEANQRFSDWQRPVSEIASYLLSDSRKRKQIGQERLDAVQDPRAVTALEVILVPASEAVANNTLDVIGRLEGREVTESLMRISVFSPWESVRQHGLQLLSKRNRYDYVPELMNRLLSPLTASRTITTDANGNVNYQYVLFQRDIDSDAVRHFDSVLLQNPMSDLELRGNLVRDAGRRSLQADVIVQQMNNTIQERNRAIHNVLKAATGVDPGETPEDWWRWWYDENEVTLYERPVSYTRVQNTEISEIYAREPRIPVVSGAVTTGARGECLVAGTPVWTDRGPMAVETLMIGDRVLCQDTDTRELEYCTVLQPTVRPPTPTFRISMDGEIVQASGGHLFWIEKQGWTKVRDMKPGMMLTTASGQPVAIDTIETADTVELYNLIVDRNANYFVGLNQILSHDSTILARGEKSVEVLAKE